MAKYRLLAEHVTKDGVILAAGTLVGDDTAVPWPGEPSNLMEPLDDDATKKVNELHQRLYGRDFVHPGALTPEQQKVREESDKKAEAEEKKVLDGDPVSEQQRVEREGVVAPVPASPTRQASPTKGGATVASPGPASPKVEDEDVRPKKPNEQQYPKG